MMRGEDRRLMPVAVIGLGLMGRSIATSLLAAGHMVTGVTNDLEASASEPEEIQATLEEMREEGLLDKSAESVMRDFGMTTDLQEIAGAGIVCESVTEDLQLKRKLLLDAEHVVSTDCILASNTSALPVSLLQERAVHPERILGVHWDEPAHVTRFMEIIPGGRTSGEYLDRIAELAQLWGKEPSVLRKEIRGFITNRISYAMLREACHLV